MKLKLILLLLVISQFTKAQTLTADFTYSVTCNNTVCFTDLSVSNPAAITAFLWDFTDNGSIDNTFQNPCYIYPFAGTHAVRLIIINSNGDRDSITKLVVTNTSPVSIITYSNATCNGICDGFATIGVVGGTPPYTYSSVPTAINDANPTNLCAGIYTVITTDANGCTYSDMLTIINAGGTSLPNATVSTTVYYESCYLAGDGSIDLEITGTNPGPFTYQWSNGASTEDLNNITSGAYWVNITDGNAHCITLHDSVYSSGINCGTISGNVYIDNNSDCINNSGDYPCHNTIIINPGNRLGYTNAQGNYSINNLPYDTYSVSVSNINTNLFPSCTTTIITTVNGGNPNSINNDLALGFNSTTQPDMSVGISSTPIVPGFSNRVTYTLNNLTNMNGDGIFKAKLPSAFIPAISNVSPSTYTVSGDTVLWNYNAINYYNGITCYIDFVTPLNTPLGSLFTSCAYATTTVTDLNMTNNSTCYQRMVTGSYDPNDKSVSPVGVGANGDISANETELTYLIRFQNTGNGPAVNIVVRDTLSTNVDASTFEMLGSSHSYKVDILQGNVLRWKFNNIMLPDSNSNEPASHGYIQYRIKRTANNTQGTQIKNTAYIYFDFNEPVVTNTTLNTIETLTSIQSHRSTQNGFDVYPNPSSSAIHIKIADGSITSKTYSIKIMDVLGKEILTTNYKEEINISNLEKGIYFLSVYQNKLLIGTKKVIKE